MANEQRPTYQETVEEAYRFGRAMGNDQERRFKSMERLRELIRNDPFVAAHWEQWLRGGFANVEDFLVTLVVAMAERDADRVREGMGQWPRADEIYGPR
jgi:hypothetical protein